MDFIRRNFIIIGVLFLFAISMMSVKIITFVQDIEKGKTELNYDYEKLKKIDLNLPKVKYKHLVTKDDPSIGNPSAKVRIVEFSDFQCPYCRKSYPIIQSLLKKYGDQIYFVYRDFPLPSHPDARKAAEAGECAQDQGEFWNMHNMIFDNQENIKVPDLQRYATKVGINMKIFNKCLLSGKYAKEVEDDYKVGQYVGVSGTPSFFINDNIIRGFITFEEMERIIDEELSKNSTSK